MAAAWFFELFSTRTACSREMAFLPGHGGAKLRRFGYSCGARVFSEFRPAATSRFMAIRSDCQSLVMAASELPFGPDLSSSSIQYFMDCTTGADVNWRVLPVAHAPPKAGGEICS